MSKSNPNGGRVMTLLRSLFMCVHQQNISAEGNSLVQTLSEKFKPSSQLNEAFKSANELEGPIFELFTHLIQHTGTNEDLFRRPGNVKQMKVIINHLNEGQTIRWSEYNMYTIANVAKRFVMAIPGGILGAEGENKLLSTVRHNEEDSEEVMNQKCLQVMIGLLNEMPVPIRQLLLVLLGLLHHLAVRKSGTRVVAAEAMALSVAGTIFLNYKTPGHVSDAAKVLRCLILNFPSLGAEGQSVYQRAATAAIPSPDRHSLNAPVFPGAVDDRTIRAHDRPASDSACLIVGESRSLIFVRDSTRVAPGAVSTPLLQPLYHGAVSLRSFSGIDFSDDTAELREATVPSQRYGASVSVGDTPSTPWSALPSPHHDLWSHSSGVGLAVSGPDLLQTTGSMEPGSCTCELTAATGEQDTRSHSVCGRDLVDDSEGPGTYFLRTSSVPAAPNWGGFSGLEEDDFDEVPV